MASMKEDPIALSGVNADLEVIEEKYMDPPSDDATDNEKHAHQDIKRLLGICRGLSAAVLALSRPIYISSGK
jgi:hypothetical protein